MTPDHRAETPIDPATAIYARFAGDLRKAPHSPERCRPRKDSGNSSAGERGASSAERALARSRRARISVEA